MNIIEFLSTLRRLDVQLFADGDRLRCNAPRGALTSVLQTEIAQHKGEILAYLRQVQSAGCSPPPPIRPIPRDGEIPLAFPQQRFWFLEQLQPDAAAYHVSVTCRFTGRLDVMMLAQCLNEIIKRHEALRTTFAAVDGRPFQVIAPYLELPLPVLDLRELSTTARQAEVQHLAMVEAQHPFNLASGPLLRMTLLQLADTEHMLLLTIHHIVSDGWSAQLFFREMATLYEAFSLGKSPQLPQLPIQYADFAHWQCDWLQGEALETQLVYWRRQLNGAPMALELLTDRPRTAVHAFKGARQFLTLAQSLSESLKALSLSEGVTLFMTILAAYNVLLHRYTGQEDILVGSPVAGRNRPEIEPLIGFFVNYLVLRTQLSGNLTFQQLLHRVRDVSLAAFAHQDLPFELLLEALRPDRDLSRTPLFQVFFNMHNFGASKIALPGLTLELSSPHEPAARFDLSLYAREQPEGLQLAVLYNTELFDDATIAQMLECFQVLIENIAIDPARRLSKLPLRTASQHHQGTRRDNLIHPINPYIHFDKQQIEQSIPARFAQQVKAFPDRLAIKTRTAAWTYAMLDTVSTRVAQALLAIHGTEEERIALLFDHDPRMIACILGILKAGKAYVPLDPLYPRERLVFILEDSQAAVIVTYSKYLTLAKVSAKGTRQIIDVDNITPIDSHNELNPSISADALAYILYTSGSTGQPKGVMQSHRNVLYFSRTYTNSLHLSANDRLTLLFTYISDGAVMDIFGALLNGATLCPFDLRTDEPTQLAGWLQQEGISVYHSTPTIYRHFVRTLAGTEQFPALRLVALGGEAVYKADVEQYKRLFSADCLFVNGLGPTESTLALQSFLDKRTDLGRHAVPVGYPVDGTEILVLDNAGEPVEGYGIGEIAIRSPHIAWGYWRQPALTAAAFRPDPEGGNERVYCTGDLGRWLPDGSLAFMGRKDWQVKVRGYRVELGEIETVLSQHPAIQEAVVLANAEEPGEVRLVAYVVLWHASAPTNSKLRRWLREKLPVYMVPSAFVQLDALPLTSSGKVDRLALPTPNGAWPELDEGFVAPRTPTEEALAAIWTSVLGVESLGVHDNFFDLGGHSLLAVQVMSRVREAMQMAVPLRTLFEAPTIASFALYLKTAGTLDAPVSAIPLCPRLPEESPSASIVQEHLWVFDKVFCGLPLFNISYVVRLKGTLNAAVLEQSLNEIISRHEALRTTFATVGEQLVQVVALASPILLPLRDLCSLPEIERQNTVRRLVLEERRRPFDLARGPLFRTFLLRLSDQEHLLLLTLHHIICDGWSLGILTHELAVLYDALTAGTPAVLPALPIQYAEFAHWQRQWRFDATLRVQLTYWKAQLHDPLPILELPSDRRRGTAIQLRTAEHPFVLPHPLIETLKARSQQEGSTLFMTCLAAFKILLYGYTGQEDVCVATLVANRTRPETEGVIGCFVNTVILRTHLGGNPTTREVLRRIREASLAAYAHQDIPFEELVQTLEHERNLPRASLAQVMLIWQNAMLRPLQFSPQTLSFLPMDQHVVASNMAPTTFDIVLTLRERRQGVTGTCIYKADLFDARTISQMLNDFQIVLACLGRRPEQALATFRFLPGARGYPIEHATSSTGPLP